MKKQKGFTLLELLIALAISVIVLGVAFPFFISSYRALNETSLKSDLQGEGENIMSYMTKRAMEASKISALKDAEGKDILEDEKYSSKVSLIEFETDSGEKYEFSINGTSILYKDKATNSQRELGSNIDFVEISTIGEDKSFKKCSGIDVKLNLKKQSISYKISSSLFFRNKR